MVSPNEIGIREFKKVTRGYSSQEVDEFLDEIYEYTQGLYRENIELRDTNNILSKDIERFRSIESALERTFVLAEKTAEEIKENAEQFAVQKKAEATLKAEEMIEEAKTQVRTTNEEMYGLQLRYELMKKRIKLFLQAEMELLEETEIASE